MKLPLRITPNGHTHLSVPVRLTVEQLIPPTTPRVTKNSEQPRSPDSAEISTTRFCTQCGARLVRGATFCTQYGVKVK